MPAPFQVRDESNGNKFLFGVDTSGNTIQTGNQLVQGNSTISGNQTVSGNQIVTGTQTIGTLAPSSLTVSGNATIGGTLGVTGNTTLSGTLASGTLTVTGAATISTTLGVTGASTLTGNTTIGGTLGVTGALTASSTSTLTGLATASAGVNFPAIATPATPTTSATVFANTTTNMLQEVTPSGLVLTTSGVIQSQTATTTVASTASITSLQAFTVPANDVAAGTIYRMTGYGVYSDTGTPTLIFTLLWGGTGGTTLIATPTITLPATITNAPFSYNATINFRSTTSAFAVVNVNIDQSITTDAVTTYTAVPTGPITVTTTGANALTMAVTWSASSSSNTISLTGGMIERIA